MSELLVTPETALAAEIAVSNVISEQRRRRQTGMQFFEASLVSAVSEILQLPEYKAMIETWAKLAAQSVVPKRIEVILQHNERCTVSTQREHYYYPFILRLLTLDPKIINIYLQAEKGVGKTTLCLHAAQQLGIPAIVQSFNLMSTKTDAEGYTDAYGKYIISRFVDAFMNGKLFIADEFDRAHPAVSVILNSALANRVMTLPSGETVLAHPEFRFIACANTAGLGATDQYCAAQQQDAAILDRFVQIFMPIDPGLESHLAGLPCEDSPELDISAGDIPSISEILFIVRLTRKICADRHYLQSPSPRASQQAACLAADGIGRKLIRDCVLLKGFTPDQRQHWATEVTKDVRSEWIFN